MKYDISTILEEIYAADPSLRTDEVCLRKLIESLQTAKPHVDMDHSFVRKLRTDLQEDAFFQHKKTMSSLFFSIFSMKNFGYVALGAFICVLVLIPMYFFMQKKLPQQQMLVVDNKGQIDEQEDLLQSIEVSLAYVEGDVEYLDEGKWRGIAKGAAIHEGDSIQIPGDGKAIVIFEDDSVARLNRETRVTFQTLRKGHIVLINETGDMYTRVTKSDSRLFDVHVNDVIYRALGTAFRTFNTDEKQGLEVYESTVEATNDEETLEVTEGEALYTRYEDGEDSEGIVLAIEVESIKEDSFLAWNKEEDEQNDAFKNDLGLLVYIEGDEIEKEEVSEQSEQKEAIQTVTDKESVQDSRKKITMVPAPTQGSLRLSAKSVSNGVAFVWTVEGVDVSDGFKIVKSTSPDPVYPGNTYVYLREKNMRSYTWNIQDGQTYYFRICQYLGGKCGFYSNNIKITTPVK